MTDINDLRRRFPQAESGSARHVVVLGAGMAGLTAAYELQKLGHTVEVLEASDRVGGRVWTKEFRSNQYHELGAMRIPASHHFTRHYVHELDLKLRRFVTSHRDDDAFYDLRGEVSTIKDDARVLGRFRLSPAERHLADEKLAPSILGRYLQPVLDSLTYEDQHSLFGMESLTPRVEELDRISLGEFLEQHVQGPDTRELIGAVTGLEVWWDRALSMIIRDELVETGVGLEEIVGGMECLPRAMHKRLAPHTVKQECEVLAIERRDSKVRIRVKRPNSKPQWEEHDRVICTIPFSVLRQMSLTNFSPLKLRAIRNLAYASSAKVLLECRERFWEQQGIIGGASLSDSISRATYYPSDNYHDEKAGKEADTCRLWAADDRAYSGRSLATAAARRGRSKPQPADWDVSHGEGVLVGSYNWGRDARRLGALPHDRRVEVVIDAVSRLHQGGRGKIVGKKGIGDFVADSESMFWDEYRWAAGAFCFMQPGDLKHYYADAIAPEGNLHFAGEHTSLEQAWIQGALISALRAVEEVVT